MILCKIMILSIPPPIPAAFARALMIAINTKPTKSFIPIGKIPLWMHWLDMQKFRYSQSEVPLQSSIA
ncbi:unnamed protein product [Blepharisma stoltei]|uniref:Uncharacterized protein n=1 Tax=Blepharisma stoltei TaxID=1481888 RepID=A0AAU9KC91_9CILI|nr:unnamed protein product [Blepharisma stoltei]